jgi:dienelactone hydrolase
MIRWVVSLLAVLGLAFAVVPSVAPQDDVAYTDTGAYASGWRDIQVARRDGSVFDARVFFPATRAGADAPIASAGSPLPVIAFGHGYMQRVDSYAPLLRHLASRGFVVVAPRSFETNPFPSHSQFAGDLNAGLSAMTAQQTDSASPFFNHLDVSHFGVMGHSMGGGAALLAASNDARISAVSVWAVVDTNPSAVEAVSHDTRPMQWIAGSADGIVPADQRELWRRVTSPAPIQVPVIAGGAHCGFQSYSAFALFCDRGSLPKANQVRITQQLLTDWFSLYLRDDGSRWEAVWGKPPQTYSQVSFTLKNTAAAFPAGNTLR